jgi:hypothetical protein
MRFPADRHSCSDDETMCRPPACCDSASTSALCYSMSGSMDMELVSSVLHSVEPRVACSCARICCQVVRRATSTQLLPPHFKCCSPIRKLYNAVLLSNLLDDRSYEGTRRHALSVHACKRLCLRTHPRLPRTLMRPQGMSSPTGFSGNAGATCYNSSRVSGSDGHIDTYVLTPCTIIMHQGKVLMYMPVSV